MGVIWLTSLIWINANKRNQIPEWQKFQLLCAIWLHVLETNVSTIMLFLGACKTWYHFEVDFIIKWGIRKLCQKYIAQINKNGCYYFCLSDIKRYKKIIEITLVTNFYEWSCSIWISFLNVYTINLKHDPGRKTIGSGNFSTLYFAGIWSYEMTLTLYCKKQRKYIIQNQKR